MIKEYSEYSFDVIDPDCGIDDSIHMSVLFAHIQEAAVIGAMECGFDTLELNGRNACWIVLRYKLHLDRIPKWRERITIRTWHTGVERLYWGREYEIYDSEGVRIGYCSSAWIMADMNSHSPIIPGRTPGFDAAPLQREFKVFGETCPKLRNSNKPEVEPSIIKYADFSELDRNHHVNNSRYIAWICDALHRSNFEISQISEININYINEVLDSEKVEVFVSENENGKISVNGYKNDGTNVFLSEISICV